MYQEGQAHIREQTEKQTQQKNSVSHYYWQRKQRTHSIKIQKQAAETK